MSRHCSILGSGHRRLSEAGRWRLTTLGEEEVGRLTRPAVAPTAASLVSTSGEVLVLVSLGHCNRHCAALRQNALDSSSMCRSLLDSIALKCSRYHACMLLLLSWLCLPAFPVSKVQLEDESNMIVALFLFLFV